LAEGIMESSVQGRSHPVRRGDACGARSCPGECCLLCTMYVPRSRSLMAGTRGHGWSSPLSAAGCTRWAFGVIFCPTAAACICGSISTAVSM